MAQERSEPKRESPEEIAKKKTKTEKEKKAKPAASKAAAKKPAKKAAAKPKPKVDAKPKPTADAQPKRRSPARQRQAAPKPKAPVSRPVVQAHAKYVRSSARKARLVIDHIRGKSIDDARAVLKLNPRGVAGDIEKLLESAIANAENNHELVADDLCVKEVSADEGPTLRRFRPRAQGRATRIRKRTSHLSIALTTKEQ